jgi:hypothetical protein
MLPAGSVLTLLLSPELGSRFTGTRGNPAAMAEEGAHPPLPSLKKVSALFALGLNNRLDATRDTCRKAFR